MILKSVLLIFFAALLAGCVTHEKMTFVGGDKAEGVVKLAYGYRVYEKPIVNLTAGRQIALAKCNSWGYNEVSQEGKIIPECIRQSKIACNITYVTVEYQCSGKK